MPNVRSNSPGCFHWNSFYRFYWFREIPTTLKITGGHSYVAANVLTNVSWPANLCEWIALAATNVFEILTLLLMPVRTQFTNPSLPQPEANTLPLSHQGSPQRTGTTFVQPKEPWYSFKDNCRETPERWSTEHVGLCCHLELTQILTELNCRRFHKHLTSKQHGEDSPELRMLAECCQWPMFPLGPTPVTLSKNTK